MAKKAIPLSDLPTVSSSSSLDFSTDIFTSGAVVLMDKPLTWSSFDVVRYVRNRVPPKKVGHAGTLDPLATGLLILCTGKATRTISQIQVQPKVYETTITFGESTPSYDAALKPDAAAEWTHIDRQKIEKVLQTQFSGTILQTPPVFSAIKVDGERLYKKARRGEKLTPPPRQVTIHKIEIIDCNMPELQLRIHCGKGTYIRSVAHDLGLTLDSLAHITALRRTSIGDFNVNKALLPKELDQLLNR